MANFNVSILEILCVQNVDADPGETRIITADSSDAFKTAALGADDTFDNESLDDVSGQNAGIEMIPDSGLASRVVDAVFKR